MAGKRTRTQRDVVNRSRLNGTRIKKGLDELRDLDAKPQPVHTVPSERSCEGNAMRGKAVASRQGAAEKKRKTEVASAADGSTATKRNEKNPSVVPETIINTANSTKHCGNSSPCVFGYSWEEWKSVKRHLFDTTDKKGTAEARRRALDHVELVWTARSRHGRPLPSYVESTSLLLEVVSLDECGQLSSTAITALYGAVISRTVHLMTGTFARGDDDPYRKRGTSH
ncbi:unnamed protein product [Trypanosoma congolense IL3000]|uniref:WGS project CAEQ00000000 data, annotated contig 2312 n=1 Tax=Trypanosoma congolense (strain IL3000) TaxID=1068625 RepID=F9WD28_TRYCI|nr:unnamed protein product [Trypanosoma congolense IL3000]